MFNSRQEARDCVKGDVILVQDLETGLIYNQAFKPELMQYDADYPNEQATSGVFQQHLQDVSNIVKKYFESLSLIEVGCGKGYFLELLQGMDFDIKGLDPTYEGSNPSVIKEYFSPGAGYQADGIILRHVLEHVQDPVGFLMNIRESNGGAGKIYIEVPCLDWICKHRAWFDIFYEHVNYFRPGDFERMFGNVYEIGHTFGGQYIYVVVDLASLKVPAYNGSERYEFPADFLGSVNQYAAKYGKSTKTGLTVWGGASKGVIFSLFMGRAGVPIERVIDINPAKQGKYLAATGLQVKSPTEAMPKLTPDTDLFVMNSNYLNEIQEHTEHKLNYHLVEHESI